MSLGNRSSTTALGPLRDNILEEAVCALDTNLYMDRSLYALLSFVSGESNMPCLYLWIQGKFRDAEGSVGRCNWAGSSTEQDPGGEGDWQVILGPYGKPHYRIQT